MEKIKGKENLTTEEKIIRKIEQGFNKSSLKVVDCFLRDPMKYSRLYGVDSYLQSGETIIKEGNLHQYCGFLESGLGLLLSRDLVRLGTFVINNEPVLCPYVNPDILQRFYGKNWIRPKELTRLEYLEMKAVEKVNLVYKKMERYYDDYHMEYEFHE